jgi:hypothetical protein
VLRSRVPCQERKVKLFVSANLEKLAVLDLVATDASRAETVTVQPRNKKLSSIRDKERIERFRGVMRLSGMQTSKTRGLKLAERGGRNGKKRAIIATARKLAVLLHRLWVSAEVYEPLRNRSRRTMPAAA